MKKQCAETPCFVRKYLRTGGVDEVSEFRFALCTIYCGIRTGINNDVRPAGSYDRAHLLRIAEIAFRCGFINEEQLERSAMSIQNKDYRAYLLQVLSDVERRFAFAAEAR